jgi:hypothetical protein
MDPDVPQQGEKPAPATPEGRQALDGLRAIWTATGQMTREGLDLPSMDLECAGDEGGCTANLSFDAFADTVEPTNDTAEALDRLRRAWKSTLAKEGKLVTPEAED